MTTSYATRCAHLILACLTIGLLTNRPILAQDGRVAASNGINALVAIQLNEQIRGTTVDLEDLRLGDVLNRGGAIVMDATEPIETAFLVGIVQGGKILTQHQSEAFTLQPGSYIVGDLEDGTFTLELQQGSSDERRAYGPVEEAIFRLDVPDVMLTASSIPDSRFGDPRVGLHIEPVILQYGAPTKALQEGVWERLTKDQGLKHDASALVLMIVPTDERLRQQSPITHTLVPILPTH